MATNGITDIHSVLPSTLHLQGRQAAPQVPARVARLNAAPAVAATTQELNPIQQNALAINEALREVAFAATEAENSLLLNIDPFLNVVEATQELSPLQQSALIINETLRNLGAPPPEPRDILLINELSPALEAAEVTEELDLIRQSALQINEALQEAALAPPSPAGGLQVIPTTEEEAAAVAVQNLPVIGEERVRITAAGAVAEPGGGVAPLAEVPVTAGAAPVPAPAAPAPAVTPVAAPVVPTPEIVPPAPTPTPTLILRPDLTPYVVTVHEFRNPNPIPGIAEPIMRDLQPLLPVGMVRPTGRSRLRQVLARVAGRLKRIPRITAIPGPTQAERSIRFTLGLANEDIAASGLPLHLVFAKHEEEFAVDVYDCSDNEACRLSYEVPVALQDLPRTLGNIQQETGIIVNTES